MPAATSTLSPLAGARDFNTVHLALAYEDFGYKMATLLSFMNTATSALSILTVAVSQLQERAVSAANSGVTWSGFSTAPSALIALGSFTGSFSNLKA